MVCWQENIGHNHMPLTADRAMLQRFAGDRLVAGSPVLETRGRLQHCVSCQKLPATRQLNPSGVATEEAILPQALETGRQHVQKEAADKLVRRQRHHLLPAFVTIVLVGETDLSIFQLLH